MWDTVNAKVGAAIRFQRSKKLKITQEALASRVEMSRASVANIESGRQQLTVTQLMIFAAALNVPPTELLPQVQMSGPELPPSSLLTGQSDELREWADRLFANG
jgi:transcriptional regulator with XRE-family HTH domain